MHETTPADSAFLSIVLERITDGFLAFDADWHVVYLNAEARRLLHAYDQDVIGKYWLDAFPDARGRLFEREYTRAMREQMPVQFVEYSKTADCWFEVKAYPSADGISVYFRDVTSRIEAQREIERNARRQQALIDFGRRALAGQTFEHLLADAMELIADIVDVPVVEVFEYRPDALSPFHVARAWGWAQGSALDFRRAPVAHVEHVIRTGDVFVTSDVRLDPRARGLVPLQAAGALSCVCALIGTTAEPIGAIAVYAREARTFSVPDVRFIESLAQTIAESANSHALNQRMTEILESIRDAFVATDRHLTITYVNERMARFWQLDPAQLIGRPLAEFTERFNDGGRAYGMFEAALAADHALTFEARYGNRWFETRLYPFSAGVAGYTRDVTRRKEEQQRIIELNTELERRVEERTKQLEVANKELESFSYSVSHDLRAPLRAIDGFSIALLEDYGEQLDDRAQNYLDRVRKAAQRMADLIDALLKLSRVARVTVDRAAVDISTIATTVVGDLRDAEPERQIDIEIEPAMEANADPQLVHAVLQNLIGNAWKFTRNAKAPRIEVGRNGDGEFYVRDNGAGFDMTYQNKLYGAFQRLHAADEYEGTGIGLATVARIIHRHGGTIRAEGQVGAGATFYFTLPTVADGAAT